MSVITLMTDFGLQDGYAGVLRGVIYRIAPDAKIADITHSIPPQDILASCIILARNYRYFPSGSIHVAVVDPGVGTHRRPIAAHIGEHYFVCPDNGLLTLVLQEAEEQGWPIELVHLDQPRYWLPQVSHVFHGRDIFSPVAAHLAAGVALKDLGHPIDNPVRLALPRPEKLTDGWRGQVIQIDHFGNLSINLNASQLAGMHPLTMDVGGATIDGLAETFGDGKPGELIAMIDSSDRLSICVVNGSAAERLAVGVGASVEVRKKRI
jgi:S-adenosyl-L-methionine hydrolase (adenosine-forming)